MDSTSTSKLERLQRCLEEELDALNRATFRLEVQQAVLTTGKQRWLSEATSELGSAFSDINRSETASREALALAARSLRLSPESTLREVAAEAPDPWGIVLAFHRKDVISAVENLSRLVQTNRALLAQGLAATSAALSSLGVERNPGYDRMGAQTGARGSIGLLNARA